MKFLSIIIEHIYYMFSFQWNFAIAQQTIVTLPGMSSIADMQGD